MRMHLIAVHYADIDKKQVYGFRILDSDSNEVKDIEYNKVLPVVMNKAANIDGITFEPSTRKLKGSNGNFDRYPSLCNNRPMNNSLVIIASIDDKGYKVANYEGKCADATNSEVVSFAKRKGIANGKVVSKDGKEFISAIAGNYHNIPYVGSNLAKSKKVERKEIDREYSKQISDAVARKAQTSVTGSVLPRVITGVPSDISKLKMVDPDTGMTVDQKMAYAMLAMKATRPFYYAIFSVLNRVDTEDIDTMAVSLNTLYFNPNFVLECTLPELLFIIIHEITHIASKHRIREAGRDHSVWNTACDYYINRLIAQEFGLDAPGDVSGITVPGLSELKYKIALPIMGLYNKKVDINKDTPETLYDELEQIANEQPQQQQSGGDSGGQGDGTQGQDGDAQGQDGSNGSQSDNNSSQQNSNGSQDGSNGSQSGDSQENQSEQSGSSGSNGSNTRLDGDGESDNTDLDDLANGGNSNQQNSNQQSQQSGGSNSTNQDASNDGSDSSQGGSGQGNKDGSDTDKNADSTTSENGEQSNDKESDNSEFNDALSDIKKNTNKNSVGVDEKSDDTTSKNGDTSNGKSGNTGKDNRQGRCLGSEAKLSGKTFRGQQIPSMQDDIVDNTDDAAESNDRMEQIANSILRRAITVHKQGGHSFGGDNADWLERMVEEALAPKINWVSLLKNKLTMASQKINTFAAPDKRFRSKNMVMPGPKKLENDSLENVKVCIDTSGSITSEDLGIALTQINQLLRTYKAKAELMYWDTRVRGVYEFEDVKELMDKKPLGGGGTDADCIFEYFETERDYKIGRKKKPSIIIIFTDGCFGTINPKYKKYKDTIWVIDKRYISSFKAPFGKVAPFKHK